MRCPRCRANDYEVCLIERNDVYIGPLSENAIIAINLMTDVSEADDTADLINTMVTCRRCGSWFIKAATEYLQDAYNRHCAGKD